MIHTIDPVPLIEMDDDLSIAVGFESMALFGQLFSQLLEVVTFTVVDDPDALVRIAHRLTPAWQINHA